MGQAELQMTLFVVSELLNVYVHDAAASQVKPNVVQVRSEGAISNFLVSKLHHVVAKQQIDLFDVEVARIVEHLPHLVKVYLASVLFSLRVCVKEFEAPLHDEVNSLNFSVEDEL